MNCEFSGTDWNLIALITWDTKDGKKEPVFPTPACKCAELSGFIEQAE